MARRDGLTRATTARRHARDVCDEDCPHAEAPELWANAVTTFGDRADELSFLRSRAIDATRGSADDARAREWAGDRRTC